MNPDVILSRIRSHQERSKHTIIYKVRLDDGTYIESTIDNLANTLRKYPNFTSIGTVNLALMG